MSENIDQILESKIEDFINEHSAIIVSSLKKARDQKFALDYYIKNLDFNSKITYEGQNQLSYHLYRLYSKNYLLHIENPLQYTLDNSDDLFDDLFHGMQEAYQIPNPIVENSPKELKIELIPDIIEIEKQVEIAETLLTPNYAIKIISQLEGLKRLKEIYRNTKGDAELNHEVTHQIEWNGSQKELAELMIELYNKNYLANLNEETITKFIRFFAPTKSLRQKLYKCFDKNGEAQWDYLYMDNYKSKFQNIKPTSYRYAKPKEKLT